MSKRSARTSAIAAVLMIGIAACGGSGGTSSSPAEKTAPTASAAAVPFTGSVESGVPTCYAEPKPRALKIGFSNPLDAAEGLHITGVAIQKEVERLGGKAILVDAKGNPDVQLSGIQQLINQKVDAIIVWPLGAKVLDPALKQATAAKIPVIGVNVNLDSTDPGPGYLSQIWNGMDYAAYLEAQEASKLLPKGAAFGQIGFFLPVPSIEKLVSRAAYWGEKFGLTPAGRVNDPSGDIAGGEKAMTQLLSKYPDIKGVISYNEESATGAAAAARAAGKRNMPLIGVNGISVGYAAVRSGKIAATVKLSNAGLGICGVWGAYDAVEGQKIPPTVLAQRPVLLTKDNIDQVPTDEQFIEQRYGSGE